MMFKCTLMKEQINFKKSKSNQLTMTLTDGLRVLMTTPHDAMRPPPPTGKRIASKSGTFELKKSVLLGQSLEP
jgi:hypothetical protein